MGWICLSFSFSFFSFPVSLLLSSFPPVLSHFSSSTSLLSILIIAQLCSTNLSDQGPHLPWSVWAFSSPRCCGESRTFCIAHPQPLLDARWCSLQLDAFLSVLFSATSELLKCCAGYWILFVDLPSPITATVVGFLQASLDGLMRWVPFCHPLHHLGDAWMLC